MITRGPLLDISGVGDPVSVSQTNFELITEDLYVFTPSRVAGVATAIIGPPAVGDFVLNDLWKDAWGASWRCTVAGNPGTWRQETPAVRPGEPATGTIPVAYQILDSNDSHRQKYHAGSYVWISVGLFVPLASVPSYANNAAAISGGLVAGQTYRTGGDPDTLCIVH